MAAGMGTRFGHYTDMIPKGFIPYKGKPMVIRSIEAVRAETKLLWVMPCKEEEDEVNVSSLDRRSNLKPGI